MSSEIQRLLQQIEAESIAMQRGLSGLASVARHEYIRRYHASIDQKYLQLVEIIGTKAADYVTDILDNTQQLFECPQLADQPLPPQPTISTCPYEHAHVGDILAYKLRPNQYPTVPDALWYGRILHTIPRSPVSLGHIKPCPQRFWVECLDYSPCQEMVLATQIAGVYTPEQFEQALAEGLIVLHRP